MREVRTTDNKHNRSNKNTTLMSKLINSMNTGVVSYNFRLFSGLPSTARVGPTSTKDLIPFCKRTPDVRGTFPNGLFYVTVRM